MSNAKIKKQHQFVGNLLSIGVVINPLIYPFVSNDLTTSNFLIGSMSICFGSLFLNREICHFRSSLPSHKV